MWRGADLAVIGLNLAVMVWIGVYCARKSKSSDAYFLAGRNMAGMGGGDVDDGHHRQLHDLPGHSGLYLRRKLALLPANFTYLLAAIPGLLLFMPLFSGVGSGPPTRYLEKRFGTLGAALCRRGLHPVPDVSHGRDPVRGLPADQGHDGVFAALGHPDLRVLVATYTIAGGLEAVIWTDLIQGSP